MENVDSVLVLKARNLQKRISDLLGGADLKFYEVKLKRGWGENETHHNPIYARITHGNQHFLVHNKFKSSYSSFAMDSGSFVYLVVESGFEKGPFDNTYNSSKGRSYKTINGLINSLKKLSSIDVKTVVARSRNKLPILPGELVYFQSGIYVATNVKVNPLIPKPDKCLVTVKSYDLNKGVWTGREFDKIAKQLLVIPHREYLEKYINHEKENLPLHAMSKDLTLATIARAALGY